MASRAEPTRAEVVVAIEHRLTRVPDAEGVEGIVEGTRRVDGIGPLGVRIGVTLDAVFVAEQMLGGNRSAVGRLQQRWCERRRRGGREGHGDIQRRAFHRRPGGDGERERRGHDPADAPREPPGPTQSRAHQPMEDEQPDGDQWTRRMHPEDHGSNRWRIDSESDAEDLDADQRHARHQQRHADPEQPPPDRDGAAIGTEASAPSVPDSVDHERHQDQQPQDEVDEERPEIDPVLARCAGEPRGEVGRGEVEAVDAENAEEQQHHAKPPAEPAGHHGPSRAVSR